MVNQIFTYFDKKTVHHQPKLPVPLIMRYCGRYTPFIASVCVSVYRQKMHCTFLIESFTIMPNPSTIYHFHNRTHMNITSMLDSLDTEPFSEHDVIPVGSVNI